MDVRRVVSLALRREGPSGMRRMPLLLVVYLVIGVVVAYAENYLEDVDRTKRLLSAILAVVLWPLVLIGFDVRVT
jgi:hypothetical protein